MEQIEPVKLQTPKKSNELNPKKVKNLGLRSNTPTILRAVALIALIGAVIGIGVAFYRGGDKPFRILKGQTQLSKDVVAVINGYERRETEGDKPKYFIKADKATEFSDQHKELENVYLQVYDETGEKFDQITAHKAIYIPNANDTKLFDAYFSGNVNIATRDSLEIKTEEMAYHKADETVEIEELMEFKRDNISGKSTGANVRVAEKRLELLKEVEINANADQSVPNDQVAKADLQSAKIVAGHAVVWQNDGKVEADQNVFINLVPLNKPGKLSQPTDIKADKITANFVEKQIRTIEATGNVDVFAKPLEGSPKYTKTRANHALVTVDKELKTLELNENVYIETTQNSPQPTVINSQYAFYSKAEDKFDLKNNVEITTQQDNKPTVTRSAEATYWQAQGKIFLNGGAEIAQGDDLLKGDSMTADLFPNKKLQNAYSRGNAYLKQVTPERTTEATAGEMQAYFNEAQQIQKARLITSGNVLVIPNQQQEYTKFTLSAPKAIDLAFQPAQTQSVLSQITTEGRTTINLTAPAGKPDAANKRIVADTVKTVLNSNGKDLVKAEAVGNAELYVDPLVAKPDNYNTLVTAPRFDCDFYETGNVAKTCIASTKAKTVMKPMVPTKDRGVRTLWADKLTANFNHNTQDVERFDAVGNAKFAELDRTGTAGQFSYTAGDEVVRLRGGEPTVWDSRARAKAGEIDWDTKNQKSFLRQKVSTTYYSQKQSNGATPFGKTNAPVFVTAEQAQFDHQREIGIYSGNARAWQDNNYIRANELVLYEKEQRMDGEGKVQSMLYNATRKENGKTVTQPAFAASDKFKYTDANKQLHYEGNVDIRQGTDRTVAGMTDIFLTDTNELKQTIAQNDVVITQPNRRVRGTWVQYTAIDETAIVRGNPATVEDAEQGSTEGSQITVAMRENKVVNEGATKGGAGRVRSVYKVKNQ